MRKCMIPANLKADRTDSSKLSVRFIAKSCRKAAENLALKRGKKCCGFWFASGGLCGESEGCEAGKDVGGVEWIEFFK